MAIKLKNSPRFGILLAGIVLLFSSFAMISSYPVLADLMEPELKGDFAAGIMEDSMDELLRGGYYLYNEVHENLELNEVMQRFGSDNFFLMRKYMDYEVFSRDSEDADGEKGLLGRSSIADTKKLLEQNTDYGLRIVLEYDRNENLNTVEVDGTCANEDERYRLEQGVFNCLDEPYDYVEGERIQYFLTDPSSVKIIYAFTEQNLQRFLQNNYFSGGVYNANVEILSNMKPYLVFEWGLCFLVMAAALLIPCNKNWDLGDFPFFKMPFEVVLLAGAFAVSMEQSFASVVWNTLNHRLAGFIGDMGIPDPLNYGVEKLLNLLMWFCIFGVAYWGTTCLRAIFTMKGRYWKERTLTARILYWAEGRKNELGEQVRQGAGEATGLFRRMWKGIRGLQKRIYDGFLHVDITEQANHVIFKIVLVNFIVLTLISCFWFYGIFALLVYSGILFLFLRRYFFDIQWKYRLLLASMNLLAEGNLDAPIEGDLGVFNPMKTEIQKIQRGFKKAVDEEVKSERMKTELITNVSHDLKTPLTAIITYVDLLKKEEDPQKRKEYLAVLEKKSLRLKGLIEDLFEISKATSRNVTMNFMRADVIELLKQVGLENDSRIREAHLDIRWSLPEEKVVMLLDSQKAYRIFENLIVNITKYAMPHTRVYIEVKDEGNEVLISMKNVSAAELDFDANEITDRFVRGDASRNTEGSGLGLAIAKSFTELHYGTLEVTTEADLFKVNIRLPKRTEEFSTRNQQKNDGKSTK
nr:HAMP domain-containing sensor histidine kinase [uncultured Schaedlerella sp.]